MRGAFQRALSDCHVSMGLIAQHHIAEKSGRGGYWCMNHNWSAPLRKAAIDWSSD
jgi:hypothetical protein